MGSGTLRFEISTASGDLPVAGARIRVTDTSGTVLYEEVSDKGGLAAPVTLEAPDSSLTLDPNYTGDPYGRYNISVTAQGFRPVEIKGVQIFDEESSVLPVVMEPMTASRTRSSPNVVEIPINALQDPTPRQQDSNPPNARVLREVIIPDFITVHLGHPDNTKAQNVRVRFIDYCKNVASSEIYPHWPKASLEANILCQISLVLNRIYTEWYPSRGFNYNITNSTRVDQYYVHGRNIFDSVSAIVDRVFNQYIRRIGFKEPFYAEYCNGSTVQCKGLSQWGTVTLANQGYTPLEILKYYYPKDIEIASSNLFTGITESYPGFALRQGMSGEYVRVMQIFLTRIRGDFPNIPKIDKADGTFGPQTEAAVREFQRTFNIASDGVIGRVTWNYISRIYVAVKKLAQLVSEGQRIGIGKTPPNVVLRQGARGENVVLLQFLLNTISQYYATIPDVIETGVFDAQTTTGVQAFQREFGLTADGVVGPATWRMLYDVYNGITGNVVVPPSNIEDYPGAPLRVGMSGTAVKLIQNYLNTLAEVFPSIPKVTADGIFGPMTEQQVMAFQRLFGLTVDGIIGPSTWHSVMEQYHLLAADTYPGVALRVGSRGPEVQKIQKYLNVIRNRYTSIPLLTEDGIFGNGTAAAVREFQRIFGLAQDGIVGLNTWNAIIREYKRAAAGPAVQLTEYAAPAFPGTALKKGDRGENVRIMQSYLNSLADTYAIPKILADGIFGPKTEAAVRAFQELVGIADSGIIDLDTWKAISDSYWNLTNREAMIAAMGRLIVGKMILGN